MKKTATKKRTAAEMLLDEVRRHPSPRCKDPRQLDLIDYVYSRKKRQAFTKLDEVIAAEIDKAGRR